LRDAQHDLALTPEVALIFIPDDSPIHRIVPGRPSDLKAGQHVTVRGEADGGHITAASITIE
jgi:hypothetical protein